MENKNLHKTSKVFKFLKEVHQETIEPKKISLSEIAKNHKLSRHEVQIITSGKLVTYEGSQRNGLVYKWNTIPPNVYTADMVCKKMQEYNTKHNAKYISKPTPELVKPVEVEVPTQVEIIAEVQPKPKRKYERRVKEVKPQIVAKVSKPRTKPAAVVVESKKEFSLLWGMIKFQY